jgi:starch synthase
MNILMVCSELAPIAKTGGLADAVRGLSDALAARGHDVRVLLPGYEHLVRAPAATAPVRAPRVKQRLLELQSAAAGLASSDRRPRVYLLDLVELTPGPIYFGDDRDAARFMRLSEAAIELGPALGWQPDVLHCHDWHAALIPVVQRARRSAQSIPTVLTLHNIGYQGIFGAGVPATFGFDDVAKVVAADALAGSAINFLRAGLHEADAVSTVSPTYAREIRTPEFGMGLESVLNARGDDVVGILNGVDYGVWSPATDAFLDVHYDAGDLAPKYRIKADLVQRFGLSPDPTAPLLGVVTRLATQKGIDVLAAIVPALLATTRVNLVLLGAGEPTLAADLESLATANPRRFAFVEGYDEALSHRIFAGSDLTLVPSRYEPCGLTQMYALRYGTIPVVRATGGLVDTVQHFDPAAGTGNGSVFRNADSGGLLWGVRTALAWYDDPKARARVIANGMSADFSWQSRVPAYEALYRSVGR